MVRSGGGAIPTDHNDASVPTWELMPYGLSLANLNLKATPDK